MSGFPCLSGFSVHSWARPNEGPTEEWAEKPEKPEKPYIQNCCVNSMTWNRTLNGVVSIWIYEYTNVWICEFMIVWIYEHMSIWVFEYMNIWVCEYLNIWVYECIRI